MAKLAEDPSEAMAVALPLLRMNHNDTRALGMRVNDPWPKVLRPANPIYNPNGLVT